jgi:hypothetical protein
MNALQEKLAQLTNGGKLEEPLIRLYNTVFGSTDGQLVLEDLKMRGFIYVSPDNPDFCKSDRDAFINIGTQKLVMEIIRMSAPLTEYEMKPKETKDNVPGTINS